jgi:hypothetical protein
MPYRRTLYCIHGYMPTLNLATSSNLLGMLPWNLIWISTALDNELKQLWKSGQSIDAHRETHHQDKQVSKQVTQDNELERKCMVVILISSAEHEQAGGWGIESRNVTLI